jgi:hypothetical protein
MSTNHLSHAELLRLTSRVVAACCKAAPIDAAHLPELIASVNKAVRTEMAVLAERPSMQPVPCPNSMGDRRGLDRPQHTLRMAPMQMGRAQVLQSNCESSTPGATNIVKLNALSKPTETWVQ